MRAALVLVLLGSLVMGPVAWKSELAVLAPEETSPDKRHGKLTTLNDRFLMEVPESREAWEARAEDLRMRVRVALGLWPEPTRTPLEPWIGNTIEGEGYTIEGVSFQSMPGHLVSGSLFRPVGFEGPRPVVLCPHGHWSNGRFYTVSETNIRAQITRGEERFEDGGRNPMIARCVQLARMGCVVLLYDMLGYADSQQLEHRSGPRPDVNTPERWSLFGSQAELRLQHTMGLQTWNSVRALDFLLTLDEADPQRIGVTGASGGATQTFFLTAVDPRPAVAFPAVMVSVNMQGGCPCENAPYLRIDGGNIDLAALFAPKPLGLSAADDWTHDLETYGLPELKKVWSLYDQPDLVTGKAFLQFKHNYNYVSRSMMYHWFNKHLKLGVQEPIVEEDYPLPSREQLTVWSDENPQPPGGIEHETALLAGWDDDRNRHQEQLVHDAADGLQQYRDVVGRAFAVMVGRSMPSADPQRVEVRSRDQQAYGTRLKVLYHWPEHGEIVPALVLEPREAPTATVVWLSREGKLGLFDTDTAQPTPGVAALLERGIRVIGLDLFEQGENRTADSPEDRARVNESRWQYSGHTHGFNHPLFAQRVHDVMNVVSTASRATGGSDRVGLVALDADTAPIALAAKATGGATAIEALAVDTRGWRFDTIARIDDPAFWPGAVKYGDVPGLLSLAAPSPVLLAGEAALPEVAQATYAAADARERLMLATDRPLAQQVAAWMAQHLGEPEE